MGESGLDVETAQKRVVGIDATGKVVREGVFKLDKGDHRPCSTSSKSVIEGGL